MVPHLTTSPTGPLHDIDPFGGGGFRRVHDDRGIDEEPATVAARA